MAELFQKASELLTKCKGCGKPIDRKNAELIEYCDDCFKL